MRSGLARRRSRPSTANSRSLSGHLQRSLLLLTLAAGWMDALTFLALGKVFSSFMSGNVLFLGIAAGQRDWGFLIPVVSALAAFGLGGVLAGLLMAAEKRPGRQDELCRFALLLEWVVLLIFAGLWSMVADFPAPPAWRAGLVGLAAFAMGIQAANVFALGIPGVATNALTGTITLIVRRLALPSSAANPQEVTTGYLLLLCVAYALSAAWVVQAIDSAVTPFVPALLLFVVIGSSEITPFKSTGR